MIKIKLPPIPPSCKGFDLSSLYQLDSALILSTTLIFVHNMRDLVVNNLYFRHGCAMSKRQMQMAGTTFEVVCVCVHMSTVDVFVV